jgi:NADH-quinone oxidoreductase subunit H
MINFIILTLIQTLIIILLLLIAIAFTTLVERKILAIIQRRQGPNVIGAFGLLQPLSDGFKLMVKETVLPSNSNKFLFCLAPIISFFISLLGWSVIPFDIRSMFANISLGMLFILSVSSVGVYGIILSGWSSNSKYAFLGGLRSTAQMISYELPIGFTILNVVVCCGSLSLNEVIYAQRYVWYVCPLMIPFLIFFISGLAETNRHPFDLPEAESELVSGYNVEYSAMGFALFSLAEYSNILMMCALSSILFWGGWHAPLSFLSIFPGSFWFSIKICGFLVSFIYARALLPRYRYDQLMFLGWKILLPMSIAYLIFTISIIYSFNIYPR